MCELLGRMREKLMWQFPHTCSVHSAHQTFPDCFCREDRGLKSFRDEFRIRHADVAVELPVRVSRTSADLVVEAASFPGSVYACLLW
jgi:hypothetical protein